MITIKQIIKREPYLKEYAHKIVFNFTLWGFPEEAAVKVVSGEIKSKTDLAHYMKEVCHCDQELLKKVRELVNPL